MEKPLNRPSLEDEHSRVLWWEQQLSRCPGKQEVIFSAARALALRDAEIARFQRRLDEFVKVTAENEL